MSELAKTSIYVGVAVVALIAAFLIRPADFDAAGVQKGDKLFPEFKDASRAKELEIVRVDDSSKELNRLQIADKAGAWVIASHNDYPADAKDAEERIRQTAINLMDLEVLGTVTEVTGEHAKFGVLAPSEKTRQSNPEGVGLQIAMRDAAGGKLADLIVGKPVRGQQNQRFVRQPSQGTVYAVKFDDSKLSTNFKDWIQPDLLQLESSDLRQVTLRDYSVEHVLRPIGNGRARVEENHQERLEVAATWNPDEWKWKVDRFLEDQNGQLAEAKLLAGEEFDTKKLDDVKDALDKLEIINVEAKPQGLSGGATPDAQMLTDEKALQSLVEKGFFPSSKDQSTLLSSDGEVRVSTKEGVQYVLRFGAISGMEAKDESTKLNRYLLVTAEVDEAALAPSTPSAPSAPSAPPASEPEGDQPAAEESSALSPSQYFTALQAETPAEGEASAAGEAPAADPPAVDPPAVDPPAVDPPVVDAGNAEAPQQPSTTPPPVDPKQAELDAKRKKAEERVAELNKRFGPWYYVISEDVYRKIHLGRFDLIKEKSAEESTNVDAFRTLEKDGLNKAAPPSTPEPPDFGGLPQ